MNFNIRKKASVSEEQKFPPHVFTKVHVQCTLVVVFVFVVAVVVVVVIVVVVVVVVIVVVVVVVAVIVVVLSQPGPRDVACPCEHVAACLDQSHSAPL